MPHNLSDRYEPDRTLGLRINLVIFQRTIFLSFINSIGPWG